MKAFLSVLLFILSVMKCGAHEIKQYRLSFVSIEVDHQLLTDMLAGEAKSGQALFEHCMALRNDDKAKLVESSVIVCRSGYKATVESVFEMIFPTEYEPPELTTTIPLTNEQRAQLPPKPLKYLSMRQFWAFEPRNTGTSFEVEVTVGTGGIVEIRFAPEIVRFTRMESFVEYVDEWGDASQRAPIFEVMRVTSSMRLKPGQFELATVWTADVKKQSPVVARKVLVFIRVDDLHRR